ncbi:MAG: hypothetical protein L6266_00750 [Nanoarchaeota archaeon]|nr:hypothetical protein [Nanoarchaeota archaeon]
MIKINKISIALLLFFILAVTVYALQTVKVEIIDTSAYIATEDVLVPLALENNESVAGFQLEISHTPYLIFQGVQTTERLVNSTIETNDVDNVLKIAAVTDAGIVAGTGAILNLVFDVDENAVTGEYILNATDVVISDINTDLFPTESLYGIFTILIDSDDDGIDDSNDICPNTAGCSQFNGCSFGLDVWLPPIINQDEFDLQLGATLPLKFSAVDCSNTFYEDLGIEVRVVNQSLNKDIIFNASGTGDDFITIDDIEEQYLTIIHSNALEMPLGDYVISALFSNGLSYDIGFELVEKGDNGKGKGKN